MFGRGPVCSEPLEAGGRWRRRRTDTLPKPERLVPSPRLVSKRPPLRVCGLVGHRRPSIDVCEVAMQLPPKMCQPPRRLVGVGKGECCRKGGKGFWTANPASKTSVCSSSLLSTSDAKPLVGSHCSDREQAQDFPDTSQSRAQVLENTGFQRVRRFLLQSCPGRPLEAREGSKLGPSLAREVRRRADARTREPFAA